MVRAGIDLETRIFFGNLEVGSQRFLGAAGILDAGDIAVPGELCRRRRFDMVLGPGRNVIEIDRCLDRVRDRGEVADQSILGAGDEEGVMTAMPSTPILSNSLASCTVSNVAGIPALTMTLARPATSSTTCSVRRIFSSWVKAVKSPLVPAHMMLLPAATCRRTWARVASKLIVSSSLKQVTSATKAFLVIQSTPLVAGRRYVRHV